MKNEQKKYIQYYSTMKEQLDKITADEFGKRMAGELLKCGSSTAFFFIQQALSKIKGIPDNAYISWEDAIYLLQRISKGGNHEE